MIIIDTASNNNTSIINQAVKVLKAGGLVIFPTETTYGAGVDATNQTAVDKLLAYKSRREGKPLSIAVADQHMAEQYVELNDSARKTYQRFLPGPVTVISKSRGRVAVGVESEFGSLGIRIPDYDLVLELVRAFGKPITATSANASGKKRPYTIADILNNISQKQKDLIDLVLDARELPHNPPSTIVDTTLSTPVVFRQGAIHQNQVGKTTSTHQPKLISKSETETQQIAGKLLLQHWTTIVDKGLVIGLNGSLGQGKTVFAKGAAKFLQIEEDTTSPTYTYIEEYPYQRYQTKGTFYHLDLWKVATQQNFDTLEIDTLVQPGNVIIIEWWNQVEEFGKKKGIEPDVVVEFSESGEKRELTIIEKEMK